MIGLSFKLLRELPAMRDSIFEYFSAIFDVQISNFIKKEVSSIKSKYTGS